MCVEGVVGATNFNKRLNDVQGSFAVADLDKSRKQIAQSPNQEMVVKIRTKANV